jgi:hypothetical protein
MNRARSFFFVCLGILALAIAYHFGATTATAQAPGNPVVGVASDPSGWTVAVTANGDIYRGANNTGGGPYSLLGNIFGGSTPAQSISIGQLKAKYAK